MEPSTLIEENKHLQGIIQRRAQQLFALNRIAGVVGRSLNLKETLNTVLTIVQEVIDAEALGISLIDDDTGDVVLRAQLGWVQDFVEETPMRIPMGEGMSGEVILNDEVVVHNNLTGEEEYAVPSFRNEAFRSLILAPIHARGRTIGILSIMSHKPDQFDDDAIEMIVAVADTVGVSIDNARLHEKHLEQEDRLAAIFHSTADGIIATDQSSRINLINQAAARILEVKPGDVIGVPLREADIQDRVRDQLLQALSHDDADEVGKSFQVMLEDKRELSVHVSPVQVQSQIDGASNMDGWVIVLQDITHIREAELARVQFMQAAAHDMKNPLSVTHKSIHMLEGMLDSDDSTLQEVLQIASRGLDRVHRLIDDLLNIEKIDSGYDFTLDEVDVREMVYEISAEVVTLMEERSITYSEDIATDVPQSVPMDRSWMHRALHNYLENAAKYAPQGTVRLVVRADETSLYFEVIDNGAGIPQQAQPRIFDRFYRVEDKRDVQGSGLGLAIVRSVAAKHHGNAYLKSKEGEGSTFGLAIPLQQVSRHE